MKQTQLLMLRIQRSDGRNRLGKLVSLLYSGQVPQWDVSEYDLQVPRSRKLSEVVQVVPEPLVDLFKFTVELFQGQHAGRKLSSIECHDLCCKIAQIVVVGGGVRTISALISLSNLTDDRLEMQDTDSGT